MRPEPPVYTSILREGDIPDVLKKNTFFDQPSLDMAWSTLLDRLQTEPITENDLLQILKSGLLQTDTGKTLAPLIVEGVMRSIQPLDGLTPQRLREIVEVICQRPPEQWAKTLGENFNFKQGGNGKGVQGFIQEQLAISREGYTANDVMLDDDTWNLLRNCNWLSHLPVHDTLIELKKVFSDRPSKADAKYLIDDFVESLEEREQYGHGRYSEVVQELKKISQAIEVVDTRPDWIFLEQFAAFNPVPLQGVADIMSVAVTKLGNYLAFGPATEPASAEQSDEFAPSSNLLHWIQQFEKQASFYNDVVTTGPRPGGGLWQRFLYALNVLDTAGVLSLADKIKPHLPAVPTNEPLQVVPQEFQAPDIVPADLRDQVNEREAEVNEYLSSLPRQSNEATEPAAAATDTISAPSSALPAVASGENLLGQMAQQVMNAWSQFKDPITFPGAAGQLPEQWLNIRKLMQLDSVNEGEEYNPLTGQGPYQPLSEPVQTEPDQSWWESIAPEINSVLAQLSTVLATSATSVLLSIGGAVNQYPRASATALFAALTALHNHFSNQIPDQPEESPAAEPSFEEKIVGIVNTPAIGTNRTLADAIYERMLQSPETNLLDDEQLLEEVALLLEQHSKNAPEETFVELIQEAEAQTNAADFLPESPPMDLPSAGRVKRAAYFEAASFELPRMAAAEAVIAHGVEESTANKEVRLNDYLATMARLNGPDVEATQETAADNDTQIDPAVEAARQVIRTLRRARSVTWADSSRAVGNQQLVSFYADTMLEYAKTPNPQKTITVPRHSTFGQCWSNFVSALNNPFFIEWALKTGLDLSTVKVDASKSSLSGTVNGQSKTFTLTDNSGWADLAAPILRNARVIDPLYDGVHYTVTYTLAPFLLVAAFHGENRHLSETQAGRRADLLNTQRAFDPIPTDDWLRPLDVRSEEAVASEKRHLGDLYTHHELVKALKGIDKLADNGVVNLDNHLMKVHPDSLYAGKYPLTPERIVTAKQFISAVGWNVPKTSADVSNLIDVLSFSLPDSPYLGNGWGALAYDRPLNQEQRQTLRIETNRVVSRSDVPLFEELLNQPVNSHDQARNFILASDKAKALGASLESTFNVASTPTSTDEWIMAAVLLNLDPALGQQRNHVGGYNLTQEANFGVKPSIVVENLQRHLVANAKLSATTAPYAAHYLLAGSAPEFLVKKLPDNLVCGTHTWASFRIGVARIEQLSPGASSRMTFEQVMKYARTAPINVGQEIAVQMLSVDPLIDWAIANGVITATAGGTYTKQQLVIAQEKFQAITEELVKARDYLKTPTPTRQSLALAELTRVFGEGLPYEDQCLTTSSQVMPHEARSMVERYIDEDLQGDLASSNAKLPIDSFKPKLDELKNVGELFVKEFNEHFDHLRTGSESVFKNLVSQLPLEDRRGLEYGSQTFYSLRSEVIVDRHQQTTEMKEANKGRHGILIKSEFQQKVTYYEVFPSSSQIRKRILTEPLTLDGELKTVRSMKDPSGYIEVQSATSQPFDWEAYKNGTPPRDGVRSNVIIEKLDLMRNRVVFGPPRVDFQEVPSAFSPDSKINDIAKSIVEKHFITGKEELQTLARGVTVKEQRKAYSDKVSNFLGALVPFKSTIEKAISGDTAGAAQDFLLDACGFAIPGLGAAGKIAGVAKSGARIIPKIGKMTWIAGSTFVTAANPIDGVGDMLRAGTNAVVKLGKHAYGAVDAGIGQIRKIYGRTSAIDPAMLAKRADIATGIPNAAQAAQQADNIKAVYKDGKWYAYDVDKNQAYGPALENFRPDSAITLERTTFSDGTTAYTNTRLFDAEPHTIQHSTHTDIVVGNNVYRLDPTNPNVLNDLSSPAYFKQVDGFKDVCGTGRTKRSPHLCFSKIVDNKRDRNKNRLQSIQHKRLYPSISVNGSARKVIQDRRLYTVANNGNTQILIPSKLTEPLQFKLHTTGKIIKDKHFGLPNKQTDVDLDKNTCVIKLDGIVHGIDDQRDARAFLVNYDYQNTGIKPYLVVESDAGLFYYCDYDAAKVDNIAFNRIDTLYSDSLGNGLIKEHDKLKDQYLTAAGVSINNDFVALPPLDSLYMDLVLKKGFTQDKINELKARTLLLSDEKKREFVLAVWNRGNNRNVEIAAQTIKVEPISKAPGFNQLSPADQNKVYADGAKAQVDQQFEATGLRSGNQVISGNMDDLQRQILTRPVVIWEYSRIHAVNYADLILKTGAGNCDQMAWAAKKIIEESGGTAEIWNMPGAHTFTLVGLPRGTIPKTVDFSEPAFDPIWVVDPWAGISCPASEYMTKLEAQMNSWGVDGKMLMMTDWLSPNPTQAWNSPVDPLWIAQIIHGEKFPS